MSHEASRTGAPRVAAQIAGALRARGSRVTTLLRWPGPLQGELAAASDDLALERGRRVRALVRNRWSRSAAANRLDESVAGWNLRLRRRPDLLYLNTVKAAAYVRPAVRRGIPVILHVHEMEPLASDTLARHDLTHAWHGVQLVGCSQPVAGNLAAITGVDRTDIAVIESHVDVGGVVASATRATAPLTKSPDEIVVGACATTDRRKGTDLWLDAAARIRAEHPDLAIRWLWVGRVTEEFREQARALGLSDVVQFAGEVEDAAPWLAAMDVFCLPSRTDPFPLAVLEAMALGTPVVAFAVGGVPEQVGETGVLVPPEDVTALAEAIVDLATSPERRATLGAAAAARARARFDLPHFAQEVDRVVSAMAPDRSTAVEFAGHLVRFPAGPGDAPVISAFLVHAFRPFLLAMLRRDPEHAHLEYRAETITRAGVELELSDAMYRGFWGRSGVRRVVGKLEQVSAPFLQPLLNTRAFARADVAMAMFESQGNSVAVMRRLHLPPFTRPPLVVISCWLARDLEHFGRARRSLYRFAYRSVDRLVYFSENQGEIFTRELGIPASRLRAVPFGIDHEFFSPQATAEQDYVVAVGRDLGRDWRTFLDAVRDAGYPVKVACRPETLAGLDIPANVEVVGFVDRDAYRDLLAAAKVVVVATYAVAYPTGQSVMLEAMAMAKACVVTDTPALSEYVLDGETAVLVPAADADALRAAIERVRADAPLRAALGARARERVDAEYNAPLMWARIAEILRETID
ncbi:MAG: glycosyltransferase [Acidimicrobiia bacterium]